MLITPITVNLHIVKVHYYFLFLFLFLFSWQDVSDRIDRFDSSSDGEEKSSMAFSLNRRSKRVRSLQEPGTSLPESTSAEPGTSLLESTSAMGVADESISSSSPETECFDESGGYSRIKTSEWLNQVSESSPC